MAHFGEHITIDLYGASYDSLNNREYILDTLSELPGILEMNVLGQPVIYEAPGNNIKDPGGWSGFVVIQESHISVHTFPARGFLSADVYTCKNGMNDVFIKNYFKNRFSSKSEEVHFIKRGLQYPDKNIYGG